MYAPIPSDIDDVYKQMRTTTTYIDIIFRGNTFGLGICDRCHWGVTEILFNVFCLSQTRRERRHRFNLPQ